MSRSLALFAAIALVVSQVAITFGDGVNILVVDPAFVQMLSYQQTMVVGSQYTLKGRLLRVVGTTLSPVVGSLLYLEESLDGGNTWTEVSSAPSADDGVFEVAYVPKALGTVLLRVKHKTNTELRLGEAVSEPFEVTVVKRSLRVDLSRIPRQVLAAVTYTFGFTVSDTNAPELVWNRCFEVTTSVDATDARIRDLRYYFKQRHNQPLICLGHLDLDVGFTITFDSAGTKRLTATASSQFHETVSDNVEIEVVRQVPVLKHVYVAEHMPGVGVRMAAVFREVDDDPATGLPVSSIRVDGEEVLSAPVSTDSAGVAYFIVPTHLFVPGKQLVITTLSTEKYSGNTYVTTISLKRPVEIRASLYSTYANFDAELTVHATDLLTGDYVGAGVLYVRARSHSYGVEYSTSAHLSGAPLRIVVPAFYVRGGTMYVDIALRESPTHQDTTKVFSFNIAFRPVALTATYDGAHVRGPFKACSSYAFRVSAVDDVFKTPVAGLTIRGVVRLADYRYLSNIASGKTDESGVAVVSPYITYTERASAIVSFWVDDPYGVYAGYVDYPVTVWGCHYVRATLWQPYELRLSLGSEFQGVRADLYSCTEGWDRASMVDTKVALTGDVSFTLVERGEPGYYYYEAEMLKGTTVVYAHRFVIDARYATKVDAVDHMPKPVYASMTFTLVFSVLRWEDGKWVPAIDARVDIFEHLVGVLVGVPSVVTGVGCIPSYSHMCLASASAYPRHLGSVRVVGAPTTFSVYAYKWGGVPNEEDLTPPPIILELVVIEDPRYWRSSMMYYVPVEPLTFVGSSVVVDAFNSLTLESFRRSYPAYSSVSDPISLTTSDPLRISLTLRTSPVSVSIPVYVLIDHQYCKGDVVYCGGRRTIFAGVVYTNQPYVFDLYLLAGVYSKDCRGTGFGPIVVSVISGGLTRCCSTILELSNVRVEASGREILKVLASLSNPTVYKRLNSSITFTGMVFGESGDLLPNVPVDVSIRSLVGDRVYRSWRTRTDANGYFVFTIPNNLDLSIGKYRLVVSVPTRSEIQPYETQFIVAPQATKMVVVTAPQYVLEGNSYAISVNSYIGDPVPLQNYEVEVWYSNVVYSPSDKLSWTKLGVVVTDDRGVSTANIPSYATRLAGNATIGWMYVFATPVEDPVNPNVHLREQSGAYVPSVSRVFILKKAEDVQELLQLIEEEMRVEEGINLGGTVSSDLVGSLVAFLSVALVAALALATVRNRRYRSPQFLILRYRHPT